MRRKRNIGASFILKRHKMPKNYIMDLRDACLGASMTAFL